jgi:NADH-quinone oxidoreductase subunit L
MDYTITSIAPIVLLPFLAFVIGTMTAKKFPNFTAGMVCLSIFGSFLFSARIFNDFVFNKYSADYYIHKTFTWFDLGPAFKLNLGIYIDNMTAVLLLMVSGVGFLIHVFSTFYMGHDKRFARYMIYMSLFTTGMLGVALSDNFFSFFISRFHHYISILIIIDPFTVRFTFCSFAFCCCCLVASFCFCSNKDLRCSSYC